MADDLFDLSTYNRPDFAMPSGFSDDFWKEGLDKPNYVMADNSNPSGNFVMPQGDQGFSMDDINRLMQDFRTQNFQDISRVQDMSGGGPSLSDVQQLQSVMGRPNQWMGSLDPAAFANDMFLNLESTGRFGNQANDLALAKASGMGDLRARLQTEAFERMFGGGTDPQINRVIAAIERFMGGGETPQGPDLMSQIMPLIDQLMKPVQAGATSAQDALMALFTKNKDAMEPLFREALGATTMAPPVFGDPQTGNIVRAMQELNASNAQKQRESLSNVFASQGRSPASTVLADMNNRIGESQALANIQGAGEIERLLLPLLTNRENLTARANEANASNKTGLYGNYISGFQNMLGDLMKGSTDIATMPFRTQAAVIPGILQSVLRSQYEIPAELQGRQRAAMIQSLLDRVLGGAFDMTGGI